MASIFTRIVRGEIPCHRVYEDERHMAFLDLHPVQPGHTLVVPKAEVAYLFDMEPAAYAALWQAVRTVASRLKTATGCPRVVVQVVGWEVPHVHVHLVPTHSAADHPMPPKRTLAPDEAVAFVARMRALG